MDRIFEMYQNNQLAFIDDIINTFPFGIIILGTENIIQNINDKFIEYFRPHNKLIGESFHLNQLNCDLIEEGIAYTLLSVKNKDEIVVLHKKPLYDDGKNVIGYILLFQGYLEQQLEQNRFQQLANRDYLTKLSNRRGLYQYFDALDINQSMHFLFLDIDNFKIVNDVYGHSSGDELLVMVSSKITECSPNTFISRIGGDEFVMILPGTLTENEVTHIARKILRKISSAEYRKDILYTISISIGIVLD